MDPRLKITVLKVFKPEEVFPEPPVVVPEGFSPCDIHEVGQEFVVEKDASIPEGFCQWAWDHILTHVKVMLYGDYPWSVSPGTWVVCCTDGMRPVVFKLEKA